MAQHVPSSAIVMTSIRGSRRRSVIDWKWDRTSCSKNFLVTSLETADQHSAPSCTQGVWSSRSAVVLSLNNINITLQDRKPHCIPPPLIVLDRCASVKRCMVPVDCRFWGSCEREGQSENFIAVCVPVGKQQEELELSRMFLNHLYFEMGVLRENADKSTWKLIWISSDDLFINGWCWSQLLRPFYIPSARTLNKASVHSRLFTNMRME